MIQLGDLIRLTRAFHVMKKGAHKQTILEIGEICLCIGFRQVIDGKYKLFRIFYDNEVYESASWFKEKAEKRTFKIISKI